MKRKFGNLLMAATLVFAVGAFFTSCRDHDEELVAEMHSQIVDQLNEQLAGDAQGTLADAEKAIKATEQDIDALKQRVDSLANLDHSICNHICDTCDHVCKECEHICDHSEYATKAELKQAVDSLGQLVATKEILKEAVDSLAGVLRGEYATVVEQFGALSTTLNTVVEQIKTLASNADLEKLTERVEAIEQADYQKQIDEIWGKLNPVLELAAATDARSKADSVRIDVLEANDIEISQALKDSIAAVRAEAAANLQAAKDYADAAVKVVADELAATNATVAELQETFKQAVAELQDQIDVLAEELGNLKDDVVAVNARVDEVVKDLEEVVKDLEEVEKYLEDQITSVVLNGAYSPVVGYFNLPTGVKSNILAAYYGEANDFHFPTTRTVYNVGGSAAFTDADFELLGITEVEQAGGTYVAPGANAGKVYMTINPAEVSLEGKTFALVNSLGEASPATLSTPVPSKDKLAFGYTRDGAVVLYEAEARIEAEDVADAKIRLELSDLKDALKDVVTVKDGVNVTNLITTLYESVNNIADAHAVQAVWTDTEGAAHTVYSDYALATVAIKPLGYNFMADVNLQSFPGYHRGMNLVNRVFDRVGTINIPDLGLSNLSAKLESINFGGAIGEYIEFNVKYSDTIKKGIPFQTTVEVELPLKNIELQIPVPVEGQEIHTGAYDINGEEIIVQIEPDTVEVDYTIRAEDIAAGSTSVTIDEVIEVEIPVEFEVPVKIATEDVLGDLGGTLDSLDDLMAEVNGMIANLNGKVETVEDYINAAKDKVQNELNKYLDKLNRALCKVVNSFNDVLQPTMLVSTADGFSMLSSIKGAPTTIDKASAVLVPTSFTAEILAPASMKYVAVTNAYDAKGNVDVAAAKAANTGDLNTVLEGGVRTVQFNGKSGYTYEITYSAADYYGMISTTKYYVKVK